MNSAAIESACMFQFWQRQFAGAARVAIERGDLATARVFQRKAAESYRQAVWAMRDYQRKG